MSPARIRDRCVAPGCHQGIAVGTTVCDDHLYGRLPWEKPTPLQCNVPGCDLLRDRRGMCTAHYMRWYRGGDVRAERPLARNQHTRDNDSPFYADLPCPSCGDRRTVPFDPKPERAGRPPSSGLGTCVACGHIFSALARSASAEPITSPRPDAGAERGTAGLRRPPQHSHDCAPCTGPGGSTKDPREASPGGPKAAAGTAAREG